MGIESEKKQNSFSVDVIFYYQATTASNVLFKSLAEGKPKIGVARPRHCSCMATKPIYILSGYRFMVILLHVDHDSKLN